ncbi:hypothetical protein Q2941_25335 [Bradyrhizobium sp. UFLA05-153]
MVTLLFRILVALAVLLGAEQAAHAVDIGGLVIDAAKGTVDKIAKSAGKTLESVLKNPGEALPVCWGHPQDCRDDDEKKPPTVSVPPPPPPPVLYSASYRVDCLDAQSGRDRGDQTLTTTSPESLEAARSEIRRQLKSGVDLCRQADETRVTKAGSGRWL